ncbi:hypothetical protein SLEP1_g30384 [Rubroshorea leprosula]|uniref:Uncharacterized protein n=1 Tax=Rubroshorea leprosula TaxID=152421 RepID=A0AAV5K5K7_9ROSI|nr:hypothetical protein SLEP1_g30384 [Rubroshorea leprosula]
MNELVVKECPKLEIFSDGETYTSELEKKLNADDLNATIKTLNAEKRDTLEELGYLHWNLANLWAPLSAEGI